jgi:hypothetical protein
MWLPQKLVFSLFFISWKIRNNNGWFGGNYPPISGNLHISRYFRCQSHPIFGGLFSANQSRSLRNACFAFAMLAGIDALLKEAWCFLGCGRVIDVLLVKEMIRWSKKGCLAMFFDIGCYCTGIIFVCTVQSCTDYRVCWSNSCDNHAIRISQLRS